MAALVSRCPKRARIDADALEASMLDESFLDPMEELMRQLNASLLIHNQPPKKAIAAIHRQLLQRKSQSRYTAVAQQQLLPHSITQKLYGNLLLQWGYWLPSMQKWSHNESPFSEFFTLLLHTISTIHSYYQPANDDQQKETLLLILTTIEYSHQKNNNQEDKDHSTLSRLEHTAWNLLQNWLHYSPRHRVGMLFENDLGLCEKVLLRLLNHHHRHQSCEQYYGQAPHEGTILHFLQSMALDRQHMGPATRRMIELVLLAAQSNSFEFVGMTTRENLFYWNCCFGSGALISTIEDGANKLTNLFVNTIQSEDGDGFHAVLDSMIAAIPKSRNNHCVLSVTENLLPFLRPSPQQQQLSGYCLSKVHACLNECLQHSEFSSDAWKSLGETADTVLMNVTDTIGQQRDSPVTQKLLLTMLSATWESYVQLDVSKCLGVISEVLISPQFPFPLKERVSTTLLSWSKDAHRLQHTLTVCPTVLRSLAQASSTEFTPDLLRSNTVAVLENSLNLKGQTNSNLCREPKVLDTLVRATTLPSRNGMDTVEDVQTQSAQILLRLAKNPCNRRLLAKHTGLLSSLIKYARDTPSAVTLRDEMKRELLLLAGSL